MDVEVMLQLIKFFIILEEVTSQSDKLGCTHKFGRNIQIEKSIAMILSKPFKSEDHDGKCDLVIV